MVALATVGATRVVPAVAMVALQDHMFTDPVGVALGVTAETAETAVSAGPVEPLVQMALAVVGAVPFMSTAAIPAARATSINTSTPAVGVEVLACMDEEPAVLEVLVDQVRVMGVMALPTYPGHLRTMQAVVVAVGGILQLSLKRVVELLVLLITAGETEFPVA